MEEELVEQIVKILKDNEKILSDGYGFYCDWDYVDETLEGIARQIVSLLTKRSPDEKPVTPQDIVGRWMDKHLGESITWEKTYLALVGAGDLLEELGILEPCVVPIQDDLHTNDAAQAWGAEIAPVQGAGCGD